jgi:hypothetical protein
MCVAAAALVVVVAAALLVVVVMVTSSHRASGSGRESSAQCNAGHLVLCAAAIIGGAAPSASCYENLRAQQGCFCQYARNPAYRRYIDSPTAHSVRVYTTIRY